jgi:WD40 repeat protein
MSRLLERFRKPKAVAPDWEARLGEYILQIAVSNSLKRVACATVEGPIHVLDADTGLLRHVLTGHTTGTLCLAMHPSGKLLASSGQDGFIRIWDIVKGTQRHGMEAGHAWGAKVAWSRDGELLASAAGRSLRVWTSDGKLAQEYPGHSSTISDIEFLPKSKGLASCEYGAVHFWAHGKKDPQRSFQWKGSLLSLAISPDEKFVAAGGQDSTVHVWRVNDGSDMQMSGYPCKVRELSWNRTGQWLATGGGPAPCIWDCSGKGPADSQPLQFKAHKKPVTALAFSPSTEILACVGQDGCLGFWRMRQESKPLAASAIEEGYSALTWSHDGGAVYTGSEQGRVARYAAPTPN